MKEPRGIKKQVLEKNNILQAPLQYNILMNALALILSFATLFALVSGSEFSILPRNFYQIKGLVNSNQFNDSYALVLDGPNENGRFTVLAPIISKIMNFNNENSGNFKSRDYFAKILIKPENLTNFEWNSPKKLNVDETFAQYEATRILSGFPRVPLTEDDKEVLNGFVKLLQKLCKTDSTVFLADNDINAIVRVIGAMICQMYGHDGMVFVCESDLNMYRNLEYAWDRIGVWLA